MHRFILALACATSSLVFVGCGNVATTHDARLEPVDASDPNDAPIDSLVPIDADAGPDRVVQLAAGQHVTCAVKDSGGVLCWGANDFGQLGVAPATTTSTCSAFGRMSACRSTPTLVPGLAEATSVAVGFFHACAVKRDGTVWCWGRNRSGEVGHDPALDATCGTTACAPTPTQVAGLANVAEVIAAGDHSCARTTAGEVRCWGANADGTLGTGTFGAASATPVAASGLSSGVTRIASAGYGHTTCAIKAGEVYCWGINWSEGNLGIPPGSPSCTTVSCSPTPTKVAGITGAFDLSVGERAACVAVTGGDVRCWGSNGFGQLGISVNEPSGYLHRLVPGLTQVVALQGSMSVTCARTQDGALRCWGQASAGGIGDGSITGAACSLAPCRPTPTIVSFAQPVALHSTGMSSMVIDTDGALFAWGANGFGELGHAPGTAGDATCGDGTCRATPGALVVP